MSNAAILIHSNAYDTSGAQLLGRHSAGESFLRGFLRHADVDRIHLWNAYGQPQARLEEIVARIEPTTRPIRWVPQTARAALSDPGVLYWPQPSLAEEARHRMLYGSRAYGICGITHTTATAAVMDMLGDMLVAPTDGHDALICTSSAVRMAVETQLGMMRDYMLAEYGPRRRPEPMRVTIPLGLNTEDFAASPEHRTAWRARLSIPDGAVVALYVGRHDVRTKMNPALMALALERAAQRTSRPIVWLNSGWVDPESQTETFHAQVKALCPSVTYLSVDGRQPDTRFSIWSAADFFISLSDNIQETFGLTPVEAMAAGLPGVVSDWNGYKDTLRHGVDGFRVPTLAPRAAMGADLAYWFSNGWVNYSTYVAGVAQYTAVDLGEAEAAILALVEDDGKRREMGAAAARRAREVFDWRAIIPQYQALWAEQNARRLSAPQDPGEPRNDPYRPDPYTLFAGYPTRALQPSDQVSLRPGMDQPTVLARLGGPLAAYARFNHISAADVTAVVDALRTGGPATVAQLLELAPPARRGQVERGLIHLARHDVVAIRAMDA